MFNISRNTINLWFQRKAETGDVKPKPRPTSSQTAKISDWDKFRDFVKEHGDKTQSENGRAMGGRDQSTNYFAGIGEDWA